MQVWDALLKPWLSEPKISLCKPPHSQRRTDAMADIYEWYASVDALAELGKGDGRVADRCTEGSSWA